MLRGSSVPWDLRVIESYDSYSFFDFSVPVGVYGDCYDRYLIRLDEMRESLGIIYQCLNFLRCSDFAVNFVDDYKFLLPSRAVMKFSMSL